ncbi:MAG: hypothetical protein HPZ94_02495 [Christensenellaceae bacterium]|nr:hypothetical protein [Christensenellaceae bacterium]
MPTIIECITQAEAKGAELKKQAAARAKEITDYAEARRVRTIKEAHDAGRAMIQRAKDEAEKQGAALAAELTARADKEAAEECARAEARLRAAAEYIVREVIKA